MPWAWKEDSEGFGRKARQGSQAQTAAWDCPVPGCIAVGAKANFPSRDTCHWCFLPRAAIGACRDVQRSTDRTAAQQAAKEFVVKAGGTSLGHKSSSKRQRRRAAKGVAHADGPVNVSEDTALPPGSATAGTAAAARPEGGATQHGKASSVALALPGDVLSDAKLLEPALGPLVTLMAGDTLPQAPLSLPTAADALARCLRDNGPCTSAAERTSRETTIDRLKLARQALVDAGDAALAKDVGVKLAAEEAVLAKLVKAAPTPMKEALALEQARSAFALAVQGRKDRAAIAAARSRERSEKRSAFLQDLRAQLDVVAAAVSRVEAEHAAAHAERTSLHAQHEEAVLKLFDARSQGLPPGAADKAAPMDATAAQEGSPMVEELDELERLKAKIRVQEAELQSALANSASRQSSPIDVAFAHTVDEAANRALPELDVPQGQQFRDCGQLYGLLAQWVLYGACVPFSFGDLETHASSSNLRDLMRLLLGDLWGLWFPAGGTVEPSTIIPR